LHTRTGAHVFYFPLYRRLPHWRPLASCAKRRKHLPLAAAGHQHTRTNLAICVFQVSQNQPFSRVALLAVRFCAWRFERAIALQIAAAVAMFFSLQPHRTPAAATALGASGARDPDVRSTINFPKMDRYSLNVCACIWR
jgi:hypothetical protein